MLTMLLAILALTALSLGAIMVAAHLANVRVNATVETLLRMHNDLRPALLTVRVDADRTAALRRAQARDSSLGR